MRSSFFQKQRYHMVMGLQEVDVEDEKRHAYHGLRLAYKMISTGLRFSGVSVFHILGMIVSGLRLYT